MIDRNEIHMQGPDAWYLVATMRIQRRRTFGAILVCACFTQTLALVPRYLRPKATESSRNFLSSNVFPSIATSGCRSRRSWNGMLQQLSSNEQSSSNQPSRRSNILDKAARKLKSLQVRSNARFQALSRRGRRILFAQWMILLLLFGSLAKARISRHASGSLPPIEVSYSSFLDLVERQNTKGAAAAASESGTTMTHVRVGSDKIVYRLYRSKQGEAVVAAPPPTTTTTKTKTKRSATVSPFVTAYTRKIPASPELVDLFRQHDIDFSASSAVGKTNPAVLTVRALMATFYLLFLWRLYRTMAGQGSDAGAPGKLASGLVPGTSFDDIAGIDDAKQEVMELVDTLRFPDKYALLGARAPTGLLLEGPPGTGKTMLARATAATAGVPLLYCSGSDFVEMFVGRGAARIRKLFERAQKLAPCIIFIDELDALGKARDSGGGIGGMSGFRSNDEAEQTLNQLLAAMDGLDSSRRICVLAATNRKEVLDAALIRPGRFDRIVKLRLPDARGREQILRVHTRKLPGFVECSGVDPGGRPGAIGKGRAVDLSALAAVTDGLSGAELEFLVNEAAIRAVRRVSAALRDGIGVHDIVPHVEARDFEASLYNFYETRRPKGMGGLLKDLWK